jgi:hypothetical protein
MRRSLAGLEKKAGPVSDKTYADVVAALAAGKNIPLAKALLNRIADLRELAARGHLPQWATAFTEEAKPMAPAEIETLKKYAARILTPQFVANAPALAP